MNSLNKILKFKISINKVFFTKSFDNKNEMFTFQKCKLN